jgi:hypothetical protein
MKAYTLTTDQQTEAAALKAAVLTAQAALVAANQALTAYLTSATCNLAGSPPSSTLKSGQRLQLTADGTMAILLP